MANNLNHARQDGKHDDRHDQQLQVLLHHRQIAKQIAGIGEQQHPQQRPNHVIGCKMTIGHMPHSRHKRREGSDYRHKARQDNGFPAVTFVKAVGFIQIAATEYL
ncbi:Uncharacterised protein [Klebsiella pneumoniae]|nr:Uncharacterised protein [Klebsiella pneumoniae]